MSNERRIFYISVDKKDAGKLIDTVGQFPSAQIKDFGNRPDLERLFASQREVVPADIKAGWEQEITDLQKQINLIRKGLVERNPVVQAGFYSLFDRHKRILEHHVGTVDFKNFVQSTYQLFYDSCDKYGQDKIPPVFYSNHRGKLAKRYKRKVGYINPRETRFLIERDWLDGKEKVDRGAFVLKEDVADFHSMMATADFNYIRSITGRLKK